MTMNYEIMASVYNNKNLDYMQFLANLTSYNTVA